MVKVPYKVLSLNKNNLNHTKYFHDGLFCIYNVFLRFLDAFIHLNTFTVLALAVTLIIKQVVHVKRMNLNKTIALLVLHIDNYSLYRIEGNTMPLKNTLILLPLKLHNPNNCRCPSRTHISSLTRKCSSTLSNNC